MSFRLEEEILNSSKISQSFRCFQMILTFFLIFQIVGYSQTDWVRWEKSDPTYQIKDFYQIPDYDLTIRSTSNAVIKPIVYGYRFFISDVDGDNCPFNPSCSEFLLESVKETNLAQGILMFFDRFIRDTNFYGRKEHYPHYDSKHFYDPVSLYTLDDRKIKFIPANSYVNE